MNNGTWLVGAMVAVTLGAFGSVGCAKNEAATSACSSSESGDACGACCTSNGASGHKYATGSTCTCLGGSATKAPKSAPANFAGTYRSTWGATVFTQNGSAVTAKYDKGSMVCRASGDTLDCDWKEAASSGRAKLVLAPDGTMKGTWGTGASATNGGPWLFSR